MVVERQAALVLRSGESTSRALDDVGGLHHDDIAKHLVADHNRGSARA
jgi:hypothetical protein